MIHFLFYTFSTLQITPSPPKYSGSHPHTPWVHPQNLFFFQFQGRYEYPSLAFYFTYPLCVCIYIIVIFSIKANIHLYVPSLSFYILLT